jgi:replication factor A1
MAAGDPTVEPVIPEDRRVKDLRVTDRPVAITARILSVERREVRRRSDGGRRQILSGVLGDGTGTIRFTWWDPPNEEIERGTVIRAAPVEVREFQGHPELTFGWKTRVAPASEHELPVIDPEEAVRLSVADLGSVPELFRIEGRVEEIAPKRVMVGTDRREIHEGLLADRSGVVAFTAWTDFRLRAGESLRITGATVRPFRGRRQLTLDEGSRVERIPDLALDPTAPSLGLAIVRLGVLVGRGSAERATVRGRAVAVQPPSGLILRCPTCDRAMRDGLCRIHGAVDGRPDLRLRLVLDDGTGTITVNLDGEPVERLTGTTLAAVRERVAGGLDPAGISHEWLTQLFARSLRARGPTTVDDFGLAMYPTETQFDEPDPAFEEAELRARFERSGP